LVDPNELVNKHIAEKHKVNEEGFCEICKVAFLDPSKKSTNLEQDAQVIAEMWLAPRLKESQVFNRSIPIENHEGIKQKLEIQREGFLEQSDRAQQLAKKLNDEEEVRYKLIKIAKEWINHNTEFLNYLKNSGIWSPELIGEFNKCPNCKGNMDIVCEGNNKEEVQKNIGDHILKHHPKYKKFLESIGRDPYKQEVNFQPANDRLREYYDLCYKKCPDKFAKELQRELEYIHYMDKPDEEKMRLAGLKTMEIIHKGENHIVNKVNYCEECKCLWINGEPRTPTIPPEISLEISDCTDCYQVLDKLKHDQNKDIPHTMEELLKIPEYGEHLKKKHQKAFDYFSDRFKQNKYLATQDGELTDLIKGTQPKPMRELLEKKIEEGTNFTLPSNAFVMWTKLGFQNNPVMDIKLEEWEFMKRYAGICQNCKKSFALVLRSEQLTLSYHYDKLCLTCISNIDPKQAIIITNKLSEKQQAWGDMEIDPMRNVFLSMPLTEKVSILNHVMEEIDKLPSDQKPIKGDPSFTSYDKANEIGRKLNMPSEDLAFCIADVYSFYEKREKHNHPVGEYHPDDCDECMKNVMLKPTEKGIIHYLAEDFIDALIKEKGLQPAYSNAEIKFLEFLEKNIYTKYPPPKDGEYDNFTEEVYKKNPELKSQVEHVMSHITLESFGVKDQDVCKRVDELTDEQKQKLLQEVKLILSKKRSKDAKNQELEEKKKEKETYNELKNCQWCKKIVLDETISDKENVKIYARHLQLYHREVDLVLRNTYKKTHRDIFMRVRLRLDLKKPIRADKPVIVGSISYWPYSKARSFLKKENITSKSEFKIFSKTQDFPDQIPPNPEQIYSEFTSWPELLGCKIYDYRKDQKAMSPERIQDFCQSFVDCWKFYDFWTDGSLIDMIQTMGLYDHKDPVVRNFITRFSELWHDPAKRADLIKMIEESRFDMKSGLFTNLPVDASAEGNTYTKRKYTKIIRTRRKSLMHEPIKVSIHDIFESFKKFKPLIADDRFMKNTIEMTKKFIWNQILDPQNREKQLKELWAMDYNGNEFHDSVLAKFLDEYETVSSITFPNWIAPFEPNLMQKYTAYQEIRRNGFANFSSTGTGKTDSAFGSIDHCKAKLIIVVCPNSIVNQWANVARQTLKDLVVTTGTELFGGNLMRNVRRVHIINYEKFSFESTYSQIKKQVYREILHKGYKIDMVVFDESQEVKQRNIEPSHRREHLDKLLKEIRKRNKNLKVLALTATPVINNVREGKKLLEMITGEGYPFLSELDTVKAATQLHTEFQPMSIRYIRDFGIKQQVHYYDVKQVIPEFIPAKSLRELATSTLKCEQLLSLSKIPETIKLIKRLKEENPKQGIIVYTEWVSEIISNLEHDLMEEHWKVGLYTGDTDTKERDENLHKFANGYLDVLIASSPVAQGVDGLQKNCKDIIFLTIPWTYAKLEQTVGRIKREGQKEKEIHIHILRGIFDFPETNEVYEYDLKYKLERIDIKKDLGNCVTDGTIPDFDRLGIVKMQRKSFYDKILKWAVKKEKIARDIKIQEGTN
jgi:superfamily II DNA or RNA helicase